nr:Chain B, T. brucei PFK PTS1 peptide Ac-HEELAKL [synthetic construct]
HEELAKL